MKPRDHAEASDSGKRASLGGPIREFVRRTGRRLWFLVGLLAITIGLSAHLWLQARRFFVIGKPLAPGKVHPEIAGGFQSVLLLAPNGSLWEWGSLPRGSNHVVQWVHRPRQVGRSRDWIAVSRSSSHALALKANGTIWGWGRNHDGQLGSVPDGIVEPALVNGETNWAQIHAANGWSFAIKRDGSLWAWGRNDRGMLGIGTTNSPSRPERVSGMEWKSVSTSFNGSYGIQSDGSLWSWGEPSKRFIPQRVASAANWSKIVAYQNGMAGLKIDGSVQLIDCDINTMDQRFLGQKRWKDLAFAGNVIWLKDTRGRWWCGGYNTYGQLGFGDRQNVRFPTVFGDGEAWAAFNLAGSTALVLGEDGSVWFWGIDLSQAPRKQWAMKLVNYCNTAIGRTRLKIRLSLSDRRYVLSPEKLWQLPRQNRSEP